MSKKYLFIGQIKDLKELASKMELMTNHIYELIDRIEPRVSTNGVKPNGVKPSQFWEDTFTNQLHYVMSNGNDKTIG